MNFLKGVVFLTILVSFMYGENNIGIQIGDKKYSKNSTVGDSGSSITKNCKIKDFTKLHIKTVAMVEVQAGKDTSCKLIADSNIASVMTFTVVDSTLTIDSSKSFNTSGDLKVILTTKKLEGITSDTASTIKFSDVKSDKLVLKLYGSSFVVGKGRVDNLGVYTEGAVEANLKELKAKNVVIQTDGSSEVALWVDEYLDAKSNGTSEIRYKGNPKKIKKEAKGVSEIEKDD